ncbi:helix-turn-helix domain-containing protein [Fusibacter ferrireducens]|uniref:MerR family transcriptional regulator n=1 Tax=Fusibacter ferrireducens TaxID=2785058 RepID=A0ABR9ZRE2_9FIRM|nr:MerR family transcriptional regulator [Fusibacter ferrireducens]MBF4692209.1 MerR family transcriptional regulator [Fusibacter ferrireducens]
MKREITIGEFANLMDVSTHQIRYFEEKGVLYPSYIDENGYRMYGIEQIYILSHILLLRRLNISVSDIKKQFATFLPDDYIDTLEKSIVDIEKQIDALQMLKDSTAKIIKKAKSNQKYMNAFTIKNLPERHLSLIQKTDPSFSFNARNLYNLLYKSNKVEHVYRNDFITLITKNHLHICIESDNIRDYILKEGAYLSYQFLIKEERELDRMIEHFFNYAKENQFQLKGHLIEIENSDIAMFYNDKLSIELQMLTY